MNEILYRASIKKSVIKNVFILFYAILLCK